MHRHDQDGRPIPDSQELEAELYGVRMKVERSFTYIHCRVVDPAVLFLLA